MIDAGLPLIGFVIAEGNDIRAVRLHRVQSVRQRLGREQASADSATPGRRKHDSPRGKQTRVKVVPRPVGQLHKSFVGQIELEDAPNVRTGCRGKQKPCGVVAELQA